MQIDMYNHRDFFHIDEASSNDEYLYIDIPSRGVSLQIKIEEEGVVVDAFPQNDQECSDAVATMCVAMEDVIPTKED